MTWAIEYHVGNLCAGEVNMNGGTVVDYVGSIMEGHERRGIWISDPFPVANGERGSYYVGLLAIWRFPAFPNPKLGKGSGSYSPKVDRVGQKSKLKPG
jgi:hypothetical protein